MEMNDAALIQSAAVAMPLVGARCHKPRRTRWSIRHGPRPRCRYAERKAQPDKM